MRLFFRQTIQRVSKLWWTRRSTTQWHARELDVTKPNSVVSSTSALSIPILSSTGAFGRWYSLRVYFRKLHHACVAYAPVDLDGQVGIVIDIYLDDASQ